MPSNISKISPQEIVKISDNNGNQVPVQYNDLIQSLGEKIRQTQGNDPSQKKYKDARNAIYQAQDVSQIPGILQTNGVQWKNGAIFGGKGKGKGKSNKSMRRRSSKKNNNQKGGFTYKANTKRHSLSSRSSSSRRLSSR
jgi:hypothetical protein